MVNGQSSKSANPKVQRSKFNVQSQSPYIATHVCFMAKQWALVSDMRHIPGHNHAFFCTILECFCIILPRTMGRFP